jgi:hypothetical protein
MLEHGVRYCLAFGSGRNPRNRFSLLNVKGIRVYYRPAQILDQDAERDSMAMPEAIHGGVELQANSS